MVVRQSWPVIVPLMTVLLTQDVKAESLERGRIVLGVGRNWFEVGSKGIERRAQL